MHQVFDQRRYLIPFRAVLLPQIFTDVLVVGSGAAGLRAALAASQHSEVIVAAKAKLEQANTYWAQGGVAAVLDQRQDSYDAHVEDTINAGGDLCEQDVVRQVVTQGVDRIRELIDWGMPFDEREDAASPSRPGRDGSHLALGREGGHRHHRILHASGDATGKAMAELLLQRAKQQEHLRIFEQCFVLDLITLEGAAPRCIGAITHHPKYGLQVIWAKATILATGGAGQVFRESTNPTIATGDGLAMAYRAGAALADMAFMQFHPTTLYIAGASRSLISEAVRGEGAQLIDRNGYRFMPDYHEQAELAPRDVVSRAIITHMAQTNTSHVYLDCRAMGADRFAQRFPSIFAQLQQFEIDPDVRAIPIRPSAHYMVGGVVTDTVGRTSVQGLFAAGEVACTGLHGANRLASNSLLEALVLGEAAGRMCEQLVQDGLGMTGPVRIVSDIRPSDRSELDVSDVRSSLRSVMWRHVGIIRSGGRLEEVAEMFDFWARYTLDKIFDDRPGWELQNLLTVGALMTRAATWRTESRGTHFREDHPQPSDAMRGHDVWQARVPSPRTVAVGQGFSEMTCHQMLPANAPAASDDDEF